MGNRSDALNLLFDSYKSSVGITTDTIRVYNLMLADIPVEILFKAVQKCVTTCKFLPSIAEVREAAKSFVAEVEGSRIKGYEEAWDEVQRAVRQVGVYSPAPQWSTMEIAKVVRAIGWPELCTVESEDVNTMRAQFKAMYEAFCRRSKEEAENQGLYLTMTPEQRAKLKPADDFVKALAQKMDASVLLAEKKQ